MSPSETPNQLYIILFIKQNKMYRNSSRRYLQERLYLVSFPVFDGQIITEANHCCDIGTYFCFEYSVSIKRKNILKKKKFADNIQDIPNGFVLMGLTHQEKVTPITVKVKMSIHFIGT